MKMTNKKMKIAISILAIVAIAAIAFFTSSTLYQGKLTLKDTKLIPQSTNLPPNTLSIKNVENTVVLYPGTYTSMGNGNIKLNQDLLSKMTSIDPKVSRQLEGIGKVGKDTCCDTVCETIGDPPKTFCTTMCYSC